MKRRIDIIVIVAFIILILACFVADACSTSITNEYDAEILCTYTKQNYKMPEVTDRYTLFRTNNGAQACVVGNSTYDTCKSHTGEHVTLSYVDVYVFGKKLYTTGEKLDADWLDDKINVGYYYFIWRD